MVSTPELSQPQESTVGPADWHDNAAALFGIPEPEQTVLITSPEDLAESADHVVEQAIAKRAAELYPPKNELDQEQLARRTKQQSKRDLPLLTNLLRRWEADRYPDTRPGTDHEVETYAAEVIEFTTASNRHWLSPNYLLPDVVAFAAEELERAAADGDNTGIDEALTICATAQHYDRATNTSDSPPMPVRQRVANEHMH
jgi:hypothetical protein